MITKLRGEAKSMMVLARLLVSFSLITAVAAAPIITEGKKLLPLPGESFKLDGHDAFILLPPGAGEGTPWVWYAPTLRGLPAKSEVWMFERFLAKGIAIAGIDVGESYGSPAGRKIYSAFYDQLVTNRKFRPKPCLLARSRGGLMLYNWAAENPQSVAGVAGIYPVCNIASYPGVQRAAGAYGMSAKELEAKLTEHNPIDRLELLAKAKVPILHIHGDKDGTVPLEANSAELGRRYKALGGPVEIAVIPGQGHNMWKGWFESQQLTDFAIARALGQPLVAADPVIKAGETARLEGRLLSAAEVTKPNIVLLISDDQAWSDYGFMKHPDIQTPHLDKLAGRSLTFDRGYVSAPLCRPSLASMVTGLYPFQHGITGNDVDGRNKRAELDVPLRKAFHKHPSFIKTLTANGYLAHQSGKWWEGSYADGGFTHGMTHGDPKRGGRHGDAGLAIGRKGLEPVTKFIDGAVEAEKPFLLWYAPFLPHTPHNPPKRLLDKYTKDGRAKDVARYYAMCDWFDETCGELLDYLDAKKLSDNTLVLYICDNGWAAPSTRADDPHQKLWKGYAQRSKSSPYENGIRTPIMVSWPGQVKPGRVGDFAHAIDLFPTIAAAAGVDAPADLPGINLMDSTARKSRKRVFGVCNSTHNMTVGNPDDTLQYLWCVEGDWKVLVRYHGKDTTNYKNLHVWDTAPIRLYNVKDDPHEKVDLAAKNPEIAERLKKEIEGWREKLGS